MVLADNMPIVIGGFNSGREYEKYNGCLSSCELYDSKIGQWIRIAKELNYPRFNQSACVAENKYIYVFGGQKGNTE